MRSRNAVAVLIAFGMGLAVLPVGAQNSQQDRMKTCNADASAKALKGDERKTFMSHCLSGDSSSDKQVNSQQQKMKDCNVQAKGMKGDDRNAFISKCLKGT
jgi:hypothetical protein